MVSEKTTGRIDVPGAPEIASLTFRRFRGEEDYPPMAEVARVSREADRVEELDTAESLARQYTNTSNFDPTRDVIIAEVDGKMVGYREMIWWEQLDGIRVYHHLGFLVPDARGKGLERALVRYSENHGREAAKGHPPDRCVFGSFAADTETYLEEILKSEGYEVSRSFYEMVRPDLENIPDVQMPEGLEVRPVEPGQYREIWEAEVEAFKDHWAEGRVEEGDFQRWQQSRYFQPDLWQVAWDGDQVAGMIRNFIDEDYNERYGRKRGYTEYISTRRPWRKRGLASALIARSLRMQKELGMTESALGVDSENPSGALKVYEKMGFRAVKRFSAYRKPMARSDDPRNSS